MPYIPFDFVGMAKRWEEQCGLRSALPPYIIAPGCTLTWSSSLTKALNFDQTGCYYYFERKAEAYKRIQYLNSNVVLENDQTVFT